jgi:hypothetical protein
MQSERSRPPTGRSQPTSPTVAVSGLGFVRALALGLGSAALTVAILVAGARWLVPGTIAGPVAEGGWTNRSRAWFSARGIYPAEFDAQAGRPFSWTGAAADVRLPHLDRSEASHLSFEIPVSREPGRPPRVLQVAVDGRAVLTAQTSTDPQRLEVEIPPRVKDGAVVSLAVSDAFVPGPNDTRELGVIVTGISLAPSDGHFSVSPSVWLAAAIAVLACVAGVVLCGLSWRFGAVVSAAMAVSFALLLLHDAAFVGDYVDRLVHVGEGVAAAGLVIGLARWRWPEACGVVEWGTAAAVALAACAVQFALFGHPMAAVGDGIFQVHRASNVHAGQYFFTSVTPKPFFEFPYPVALYVTALPFWRYFPSEVDLVRLLRGVTVAAYAMAGVGLYAAARRQWGKRWPALLCVMLWPAARAPFQALGNANLTNAFGEALFGAGMAALSWNAAGKRLSVPGALMAVGFFAGGFLSHFGTVVGGAATAIAAAIALIAFGEGHARRFGVVALGVIAGAALASYVLYYSHFSNVYAESFARVVQSGGQRTAGSKVTSPPAVKIRHWLDQASDDFGRPSLAIAATSLAGLVLLLRRRRREAFTLILAAWAVVWVVFTTLEFLLPFELRFNLAAAPVFVCLPAYALGAMVDRSRVGAALAMALALAIAWYGVVVGLGCIGAI